MVEGSRQSLLTEYFKANEGKVVTLQELVKEFPQWTVVQVKQEMANAVRRNNNLKGLRVVEKSESWQYEPGALPNDAYVSKQEAPTAKTGFRTYKPKKKTATAKKVAAKKAPAKKATTKKVAASKVEVPAEPGTILRKVGTTRKGDYVLEDLVTNEVILGKHTGFSFE